MANEDNLKPFGEGPDPRRQIGRKEGSKNRSTIARQLLDTTAHILNPLTNTEEDMGYELAMTATQIKRALDGDTNAYKAVMDSAYGSPKQGVELTGENGGPINHTSDYSNLTDEELASLRAIRNRLRGSE